MTARARFVLICALGLFCAGPAHAAPHAVIPGPHRLLFSSGAGATAHGADEDGHHDEKGPGIGLHAGYGYRVLRGLELRAGLRYWNTESAVRHIAFGSGEVRGYLPIGAGDRFELGFGLRFGYCALLYPSAPEADLGTSDRIWSGPALGFGPDAHYWLDPAVGLSFALDLNGGGGSHHSSERGYYLPERAGFVAVMAWLGISTSL